MNNCAISSGKGDGQISALWVDSDFEPEQPVVYYVRVLENPSCRWATWDALALGISPPSDVPATIRERAWSSPIWYMP